MIILSCIALTAFLHTPSAINVLEWEVLEQFKWFTFDKFVHRVSIKNNNIKIFQQRIFFHHLYVGWISQTNACRQTVINLQITEFQHKKKRELKPTCSFNDEEIPLTIKAQSSCDANYCICKWQDQTVEAEINREIQEIVKKRIK